MNHYNKLLIRTPLHSIFDAFEYDFRSQRFQQGLYLSSYSLWSQLSKTDELKTTKKRKIDHALMKYWVRNCTRCTPYGTFAGVKLLDVTSGETSIILNSPEDHKISLRIDMEAMFQLVATIESIQDIKEGIKFVVNNTLYTVNDSYRFIEKIKSETSSAFKLSSVAKTSYIERIINYVGEGKTITDLQLLLSSEGVKSDESFVYIQDLIESQILISELALAVTGKNPLDLLIDKLLKIKSSHPINSLLVDLQNKLRQPNVNVNAYESICDLCREIANLQKDNGQILQADLFLETKQNRIEKAIVDNIVGQAEELLALGVDNLNPDLESFKQQFYNRYELAEVPLTEALDVDLGIGYAGIHDDSVGTTPLINDLLIGSPKPQDRIYANSLIRQFVQNKYLDYLKTGKSEIEITEDELCSVKNGRATFSEGMYIFGSLFKSHHLLDKDNFQFLVSAYAGSSGANLITRFANGDEDISRFVQNIICNEENNDDCVYAEIVHLPIARIGNVLHRPQHRKYEIPYLCASGVSTESQIHVSDLMISMKSDEIIIRSKRLQKRVIPRLTTAHHYQYNSLSVYKFLCDIQLQGKFSPSLWDWGLFSSEQYLPRVTYKNLILEKARWMLKVSDLEKIPDDKGSYKDYFEKIRGKYKIVQKVLLSEGDNTLLIDFENSDSLEMLSRLLEKNQVILLEEFIFENDNLVVFDSDGNGFTNEIIIPVYNKRQPAISHEAEINTYRVIEDRKFPPGSEWLYYKVYCGPQIADKILVNTFLPYVEDKIACGEIVQFFFVRYKDPFYHIRIRLSTTRESQKNILYEFNELMNPFLSNNTVDRISIETYVREIERYGEDLINETEKIFCNDSLASLRFLELLTMVHESEKYRLIFALRSIDLLLSDFGFSSFEKKSIAEKISKDYFAEFGGTNDLKRQLNKKYSNWQRLIFSHLDTKNDVANEIDEAVSIFTKRSEMNKAAVALLLRKCDSHSKLLKLVSDYIHMLMNRMFISQQRKYELVIYHFLSKYYSSIVTLNLGAKS